MRKSILGFVALFLSIQVFAQDITVTGRVTGADIGTGLAGVTVSVKGTTMGTISDPEGNYSITVPANSTLAFSFVGYATEERFVETSTTLDVELQVSEFTIAETVVVGYGIQKKSLVTGAISKISAEEISKGNNLRVNQAIQGKTAGVLVTNNSGQPGSFVSVRIRGTGTNGDSEPLYIVDGLPTNGNAIDYLNPSDIESIEVLKDAASAAIYGARGANGVVLITTKSGKRNEKFEVSYEGYSGLQNPWRKISVLNPVQYFEMMNESAANAGLPMPFPQSRIDTLKWVTDWQDEMFNYNALKSNHVVTFTGGTQNTSYSSSLSYFSQEGVVGIGNSQFDRFTWRLNITRDFGVLTLGSNVTLADLRTKGIDANDKFGTSMAQALNMPPIIPVKYEDGSWAIPSDFGLGMQEITNPVGLLEVRNNYSSTKKMIGGIYGEVDFGKLFATLNGLTLRTTYSTDIAYNNYRTFDPIYYLASTKYNNFDRVTQGFTQWVRWNLDNVLAYDKTFASHHFNVILGHAAFKEWDTNTEASKATLIFDDLEHAFLDNATDEESTSAWGGYNEHTILSYFGRINYDYGEKYMLSATLRRDGSSRFGEANKFGMFPSVSAGWIISREDFFPRSESLSFMKLRASWGQNGNEAIGDFAFTTTMNNSNIYYFGTTPVQYNGVQPSRIPNPNLKWETSEQMDFAIDMGFRGNRITLTLDYYIKKTKDWLVDAPAPAMIGNTAPVVNGGEIVNKGLELEFGIRDRAGDFRYNAILTGAFNKNEVLNINNAEKLLTGGDGGFGQSGILRAEVGKPMGFFYGYQVAGVFQNQAEINAYVDGEGNLIQPNAKPGDLKFVDQNGDGRLTDSDDRVNLGNPTPDFTGGLSLGLGWKGIDLDMFWYTSLGHQVWMALRRYDQPNTNYSSDWYENRWTGEGSTNEYPRITHSDGNNNLKTPSDFYVKDAGFLRLRNISLGYTLPRSLTANLKISRIRVYVAGENLITFTKYPGFEPEIGGDVFGHGIDVGVYPQARTVSGGLNITF